VLLFEQMPYADPEKRRAYMKAYNAKWYAANKEKSAASWKAWRTANPERHASRAREWRRSNPEAWRMSQLKSVPQAKRKRSYAMEEGQLERMLVEQNNACKICQVIFRSKPGKGFYPHVDHDHSTGEVRGLLCNWCNAGLGHFGDDVAKMESAIKYLRGDR
jgi:hypothetical protein